MITSNKIVMDYLHQKIYPVVLVLLLSTGSLLSQNVVISDKYGPNEPTIMMNPLNTDILVAGANISNYYLSADGGQTWTAHTLRSSYGVGGDPALDVDAQGNFYFFHLSNPKDGHWIDRIVCQKSTDNGQHWSDGSYAGLNGQKHQDKHWSVVDHSNNNIYVTWTQFDRYGSKSSSDKSNIMFSKSTDGGESWSEAVQINVVSGDCVDSDNTVEGAVPAVGPKGEIYVAWAGPNGLVFNKSLDQGESWLDHEIQISDMPGGWDYRIPGINRCNGMPITKCDLSGGPNHGTIYVNWSDQRNGIDNVDVWLAKSTDGGDTWSKPLRVNDDDTQRQQFLTWMDIDQTDGHLYFVFYDRRNYEDLQTDVYMAISNDGGNSFINKRISESPFIPSKRIFFGDYTNITAHNGIVRPIWTRLHEGRRSLLTDITPLSSILAAVQTQDVSDPLPEDSIDFRFSPPQWQTAICLPDDPHKSLVDRSGELLYHYRQGGREFGTRISVQIADTAQWMSQELYSPRVPIVRTMSGSGSIQITEEAFASTEVRPGPPPDTILLRLDDGDVLQNWADPSDHLDPSLRNIAVHMNGDILYALSVTPGGSRCIALVLCEGYWSEEGKRIQVLSVEGAKPVVVDAVADIGHNEASSFWFDASDQNGDGKIFISVKAASEGTDKNTILNGIWVFNSDTKPDNEALLTGEMNADALSDIRFANYGKPGRDDYILVKVKNTDTAAHIFHPKLLVNTVLPFAYNADRQNIVINNWETVSSSLQMLSVTEDTVAGYVIQLAPIKIKAGQTQLFYIQYTNGSYLLNGTQYVQKTVDQVVEARGKVIDYWENNSILPFNRVKIPDQGIQALLESSIRNIWQAREIKKGLPVFQVGPTCYRGLWIVDGAFLLEAATMLGAGDQARNGVAYELKLQKEDGRIESLTNDYWKENGIVLWTCVRHAQLTQDKQWLESVWPKLRLIAEYIKTLRQETLRDSLVLNDGLNPAGTLDGGIGGTHEEYTNTYWNLTGLKAFIQGAYWLGKEEEAREWEAEYKDFMRAFNKAAERDMSKDPNGNTYLPILLGEAGKKELPQRAQWAFCHAVYPGQIFAKDNDLVTGNLAMLEDTEREGMVYGTGWDPTGIWNYFASFYGHAWLWQGNGQKARQILYAFGNHAAPTLVWREEQSLKGEHFRKVGDMPHNWASAEFIRLAIHLLALDRGSELHLFEGLPKEWTRPGMITQLTGIATPFGALNLELQIADDGQSAGLSIDPLSDGSCENIIVHLDNWTTGNEKIIRLNPNKYNNLTIQIGQSN